jgi:hypothetical protein
MIPLVAEVVIAAATSRGVASGWRPRYKAATPVACAAADDVPDALERSKSLSTAAETIASPGAKRSSAAPKFENVDRWSLAAAEPTTNASPMREGE